MIASGVASLHHHVSDYWPGGARQRALEVAPRWRSESCGRASLSMRLIVLQLLLNFCSLESFRTWRGLEAEANTERTFHGRPVA
jgi:hypothetical protein